MKYPDAYTDTKSYATAIVKTLLPLRKWINEIHPYDVYSCAEYLNLHFEDDWKSWLLELPSPNILEILASITLGEGNLDMVPATFKSIIQSCRALRLPTPSEIKREETDSDCTKRGMGRKKLHEVDLLSPLLINVARENEIDVIVDFGSGLGYLTHEMAKSFKVVAIESDQKRSVAAQGRSERLDVRQRNSQSQSRITHVSEFLDVENAERIFNESTTDIPGSPYFLLTGLHVHIMFY